LKEIGGRNSGKRGDLKSLKEGVGEYSRLGKERLRKELKSEKGVGVFLERLPTEDWPLA
jgi:hypothetical protein